ncbi:alpha/beta hydrolase family esterase [Methylocella silvestris]|uniref:Phospholipase n=1 Tax=Methylocella silvestris TaxID=199596 RepID=A0A2J7TLJ3_METSI|nr:phospholipase [Methylocella silvestris]PNG27638.1 phospholipase [Methylocella silvestris]
MAEETSNAPERGILRPPFGSPGLAPVFRAKIVRERRGALAIGLAFVLSLFAVGAPPAAAASGRITVQSGGVTRTALLVQQRRLKQARRPLVVILRQAREKGPHQRRLFGLDEMSGSGGPILVYPDPLGGRWSAGPGADAAFIRDLIARLVSDGLVDRRKVFLVGIGDGGFPALQLACDNAPLLAGAAVAISAMPVDLATACKPARPVPFMMIAGTADPVVPFAGGKAALADQKSDVASVDAILAIFGKAAGCGEGRTTTAIPDRDPRDGTRAYVDRLNGCKVPVELLRVEGGGHSLPGRPLTGDGPRLGPHNNDLEAARLIWDFLRKAGS